MPPSPLHGLFLPILHLSDPLSSGGKSFLISEGHGRPVREPVHPGGSGRPRTAISMPCPATGWLCDLREVTLPLVSSFSMSEVNGLEFTCSTMCRWLWCCGSTSRSPSLSLLCPLESGPAVSAPAEKIVHVPGSGPVCDSALRTPQ